MFTVWLGPRKRPTLQISYPVLKAITNPAVLTESALPPSKAA